MYISLFLGFDWDLMRQRMGYLFIHFFAHILLYSDGPCTRWLIKPISSSCQLTAHSRLQWVHLMSVISDALHCNLHTDQNQQTSGMLSAKKQLSSIYFFVFHQHGDAPETARCYFLQSRCLFQLWCHFCLPLHVCITAESSCDREVSHHPSLPRHGTTALAGVKIRITKMLMFVFAGLRGKLWKCG